MTQRVLITGAASGLGWALTRQYLDNGWHVMLVDRDAEKLAECERQLSSEGLSRHQTHCVDLTDAEQVTAQLVPALQATDGLDLLINNAGITHRSPASLTDPDVFARVMAVNWSAPVLLAQLCLHHLERRQGGVICISSMAARMPVPGRAAYGASKAALMLHFEAWRPELLQRGIGLLMVYPSFLATSIEQNALGSDGRPTSRPRSVVGAIHSADDMAKTIVNAQRRGKRQLLSPQWSSRLGAWLWFHAPRLYQRITWRKFAEELVSPKSPS